MTRPPPLLAPRHPAALVAVLAALTGAVLRVALIPLFVTPLFDRVISQRDLSALPQVLILSIVVAVLGALMLFLQDSFTGRAAAAVAAGWREHLYARLLRRRPGDLPGSSGGLTSRILSDLKEIETFHQFGLGALVAESAAIVVILALLLSYDARTTLLLLLVSLPLALLLRQLGRRIETRSGQVQQHIEQVGGHLQEGLKHHAEVRAFAADAFMLGRFDRANAAARRAGVHRSLLAAIQTPVSQLLIFGAVAGIVLLLARSVLQGAMSLGELVSYVTLIALLAAPLQLVSKGYALYRQAKAARSRLRELEGLEPATAASGPGSARQAGEGLRLEGLSFAYPSAPPVLRELELELPPRGLIALTGESGSGKTTLLLVLLGFLRPDRGRVLLDGAPLHDLPEAELRKRLAYVPQTSELLRGSVRDNLTLGRSFPDAELWRALAAVGLRSALEAAPGDLDYELYEDGAGLSGGQRQRLAVARALLGDPRVVLLDEPSANLDEGSELTLLESLRAQATQRLLIVVAHRPALIRGADRVLRLAPDGTLSSAPAAAPGIATVSGERGPGR